MRIDGSDERNGCLIVMIALLLKVLQACLFILSCGRSMIVSLLIVYYSVSDVVSPQRLTQLSYIPECRSK